MKASKVPFPICLSAGCLKSLQKTVKSKKNYVISKLILFK